MWNVRAGALALRRCNPGGATLMQTGFFTSDPLIQADDFHFDYEPGWEIGFDRALTDRWDIGLRYLSVESWQDTTAIRASATGAVVPFISPLGNVAYPAQVVARLESELDSLEANATYHVGPRLRGLVGFRYLEFGDGGLTMLQVIGSGMNMARYQIEADNRLYGAQAGAEVTFWQGSGLTLDGSAKFGLFANHATNRAALEQIVGSGAASAAETDGTSLLAEVELGGSYQVTEYLFLRASYSFLWLGNVAEAVSQVAVSDPALDNATVNDTSDPYFHGAMLGIEYRR